MQVEVMGGQDAEIGRGQGILTPKGVYRVHALDIAWLSKVQGGRYRESMCDGVGVVIGVMARCVGEIARGVGFSQQKRKPVRMSSVLVRYAQIKARTQEGVYAVGLVW
jgi:hypothetical protein